MITRIRQELPTQRQISIFLFLSFEKRNKDFENSLSQGCPSFFKGDKMRV